MTKPEDIVTRGRHEAQVYADEGVPGACNMITELCDTITELRKRVGELDEGLRHDELVDAARDVMKEWKLWGKLTTDALTRLTAAMPKEGK